MILYHRTERRLRSQILSNGLTPRKPLEWKNLIPTKFRNRPLVWLKENLKPGTKTKVDLTICAEKLDQERLKKLDIRGVKWWIYLGKIPPKAISHREVVEGESKMNYETAIGKARTWARSARATSASASAAYEYITNMDLAESMYGREGVQTQLVYISCNLSGWKGEEAREAKKAIQAKIKELRNPSQPWHQQRHRELEDIKKFWKREGMSPKSPILNQAIGREREEALSIAVGNARNPRLDIYTKEQALLKRGLSPRSLPHQRRRSYVRGTILNIALVGGLLWWLSRK